MRAGSNGTSQSERILASMKKGESLFGYQIIARTQLPRTSVHRALIELHKAGWIEKEKSSDGRYTYKKVVEEDEEEVGDIELTVTNEAEMWHRLSRLKRMRSRIIEEYWELLDEVIKDYESTLRGYKV